MQGKLFCLFRQILKFSSKILDFFDDQKNLNQENLREEKSIIQLFDQKIKRFFLSLITPANQSFRGRKTKIWVFLIKIFASFFVLSCFPFFFFFTQFGKRFLVFVTKKIHWISKYAVKYFNPKFNDGGDDDQDKIMTVVTPLKTVPSEWHPNLYFYSNQIPSQPNGDYINEMLLKWYGNYDLLLSKQGYIQWLFPNKESSSNPSASTLTDYEVHKIKNDPELMDKLMMAFRMMLDFWGMELTMEYPFKDKDNLFKDSALCKERWSVFNRHPFLAMYVTRILKTFKEFEFQVLNFQWILYLGDLIFERNLLPNLRQSFLDFWINVLPERERQMVLSRYRRNTV